MDSTSDEFLRRLQDLFSLYEKVKLCIIYAENFDPKDELYIAPINQLRSALDHILKAAAHTDDLDYELKEAHEHIDRAGYDAFEILASNLGKTIVDKLTPYTNEELTAVFADYYQVIRPKLIEIRASLADIRKRKKNSKAGSDSSFSSYFDQVLLLLEFNKMVEVHIPAIEEYHQKRKHEEETKEEAERKNRMKERIFNAVVIGIGSAILSGIAVYILTTAMQK